MTLIDKAKEELAAITMSSLVTPTGERIRDYLTALVATTEALEKTIARFEWLAEQNKDDGNQKEWINASLKEARTALALAHKEVA